MSDPNLPNQQDLPPTLRGLSVEQLEELRQFFLRGTVCALCEWPVARRDPQPSDDDKKAFLRAVLGNGQFVKSYALWEGKLKLSFSSLNTTQSLALADLCKTVPAGTPYEQATDMFRLKLLFYLTAKNEETFIPPTAEKPPTFEEIRKVYLERFGKWNEGLLAVSIRTLQEFIRIESMLMDGGLDKAFWKSAGLV